jgi:polar amino acid transport system substrate-binding protein
MIDKAGSTLFQAGPTAREAAGRTASLALAALLLCTQARAEPAVYVDQVEPFAYREDGAMKGVLYELLRQLAVRAGHSGRVDALPLKRQAAQLRAQSGALGTVWRLPEVEASYTWIGKLLDQRVVSVTRAGSTLDISSAESMRELKVGVILGSPAEAIARRLGLRNIDTAPSAESNARKLAMGRIDVWLAGTAVVEYGQARIGGRMRDLRTGAFEHRISVYMACQRDCSAIEMDKWRRAFAMMHSDGSYARTLCDYRIRAMHAVPAGCSGAPSRIAALDNPVRAPGLP